MVLRSHDAGYEVAANQAELFERADVLSGHLPVNAETRRVVVAPIEAARAVDEYLRPAADQPAHFA